MPKMARAKTRRGSEESLANMVPQVVRGRCAMRFTGLLLPRISMAAKTTYDQGESLTVGCSFSLVDMKSDSQSRVVGEVLYTVQPLMLTHAISKDIQSGGAGMSPLIRLVLSSCSSNIVENCPVGAAKANKCQFKNQFWLGPFRRRFWNKSDRSDATSMAQQMSAPAKAQGTLMLAALKLSRNEQNPWKSYTTVSGLYFVGGAGARVHTGVKVALYCI